MRVPSGLNCALKTQWSCCNGLPRGWPVAASHTLASTLPSPAISSPLAVTIRVPSGLNCALHTQCSWRRGSPRGWPLAASQTRAVLSQLAVTMRVPSGLNCALTTVCSWRRGPPRGLPLAASHTWATPSISFAPVAASCLPPAVTMRVPSGLNCAFNTNCSRCTT